MLDSVTEESGYHTGNIETKGVTCILAPSSLNNALPTFLFSHFLNSYLAVGVLKIVSPGSQ